MNDRDFTVTAGMGWAFSYLLCIHHGNRGEESEHVHFDNEMAASHVKTLLTGKHYKNSMRHELRDVVDELP